MKEAGVYGGHEGSRAVTLIHDAGQRFKFMGQDLIPITWPKHTFKSSPTVFSGVLGEYKTFIHSYSFFLYIFLHLLL